MNRCLLFLIVAGSLASCATAPQLTPHRADPPVVEALAPDPPGVSLSYPRPADEPETLRAVMVTPDPPPEISLNAPSLAAVAGPEPYPLRLPTHANPEPETSASVVVSGAEQEGFDGESRPSLGNLYEGLDAGAGPVAIIPERRVASPASPTESASTTASGVTQPAESARPAEGAPATSSHSPEAAVAEARSSVAAAPAPRSASVQELQEVEEVQEPRETASAASAAGSLEADATLAVTGQEAVVRLPGSGWIYVGSEYAAGSVELVEKRRTAGDDVFTFRLSEPGAYGLWFQQQNVSTGTYDTHRVAVSRAISDDDERSVQTVGGQGQRRAGSTAPEVDELADVESGEPVSADYSVAITLLREGDVGEAFRELLDQSSAYDSRLDGIDDGDLRAFLEAVEQIDAPARERFLTTLSNTEHDLADDARSMLLEGASQDENPARLVSHAVTGNIAHGFEERLDDMTLFLVASQLEQIGPNRDLREALRIYRYITDHFPLSTYWERSRARAEHIERHYIDIR